VDSVVVTPTLDSVEVGRGVLLEAVARDTAGNVVSISITWKTGDTGVATVSAGSGATCGLAATGAAYCWGGLGGRSHVPIRVSYTLDFASVSIGQGYACGITNSGGAAYCRGANSVGQLGTEGDVSSGHSPPTPVQGGRTFTTVSTGSHHACGLTPEGTAYCWGDNAFGKAGAGATSTCRLYSDINNSVRHSGERTRSLVPVPVSDSLTFTALTAGGWHTCGLDPVGMAYCWGLNDLGQLGSPTSEV
jgi:hypothetical protein